MASLPTDAVAAAEFLIRHLYRPIDIAAGSRYFAVAEVESPAEDDWFWNDDNAKVLELMSRPEVWRRFPEETAEILRFVRSMCRGPFVFRRVSRPRLDVEEPQGSIGGCRHSLMRLRYDLQRCAVIAGVRFHDERTADNLMFSGNYVEFSYRGRRFRHGIVKATEYEAACEDHRLRLRHSSEVFFTPRFQQRRLGRVTYTYLFDARSMLFEVEVTLELDRGMEVSDVVLSIGHDALHYSLFTNVISDSHPDALPLFSAAAPRTRVLDVAGAGYYAMTQRHISGDALAVHSLPREPQRLRELEVVVETADRLSRVMARYAFPGRQRGSRLVAGEHKLITAGGFYERIADYADLMRREGPGNSRRQAAYDFSVSYDYGVTLNAFAKCFAVISDNAAPKPALPSEELRALVDRNLDWYFELYADRHATQPNGIFSRELAFVILATTTMCRATGDNAYRDRLRRLCEVLLDFELRFDAGGQQASAFLMRKDSPRHAYVDCHSGALLALTQAAGWVDDPRLAMTIDRALTSYGLETCWQDGGTVDTAKVIMIDEAGVLRTENAYWNMKAGLTLRLFAALENAPTLQSVARRHRNRIQLIRTVLCNQLERSLSWRDGLVELRCSVLSQETNSETQPWAMLGLVGHPYD